MTAARSRNYLNRLSQVLAVSFLLLATSAFSASFNSGTHELPMHAKPGGGFTSKPPVAGAPTVSSGTLTVTGSGFGTKTRAAPVWWDNFATATVGANVAGRAPIVDNANGANAWTTDQVGAAPTFINSVSRISGKPVVYHALTGSNYINSIRVEHALTNTGPTPLYISWWMRNSVPSGEPRQWKPIVIYGSSSPVPMFYLGYGDVGATGGSDGSLRNSMQDVLTGSTDATNVNNDNGSVNYGGGNWETSRDRWLKYELILAQSSAGTGTRLSAAKDGVYALTVFDPDYSGGARLIASAVDNPWRSRVRGYWWRSIEIGEYHGGAGDSGNGPVNAYTDEVYIDDSAEHARLVICNTPAYVNCTRPEIQPPLTWSDTNITARYNRGSYSIGSTGYLFVVRGVGRGSHGSAVGAGTMTIQ